MKCPVLWGNGDNQRKYIVLFVSPPPRRQIILRRQKKGRKICNREVKEGNIENSYSKLDIMESEYCFLNEYYNVKFAWPELV